MALEINCVHSEWRRKLEMRSVTLNLYTIVNGLKFRVEIYLVDT